MKNFYFLIICFLFFNFALSQIPQLDASFGDNGRTVTNFTDSFNHYFKSMVIQPDGKIIMLGTNDNALYTLDKAVVLARFNPDGSIDSSFAENGYFLIGNSQSYEDYKFGSVVLQADGKILIGGNVYYAPPSFGLIRLNSDGSYDSTFANKGLWVNDEDAFVQQYGIAIQSDGKILQTGYHGPVIPHMYLVRNNADGSLDSTFGIDGEVILNFDYSVGKSIAFQSNGKIIVGGANWVGSNYVDMLIARFNQDGSVDSTFGTNGYTIVPHSGDDDCKSVIVQPDDKILLGGIAGSTNKDFEIARLNANGSVDSLFGTNGVTTKNLAGNSSTDFSTGIALLPDGKIINGGLCVMGNNKFLALTRFTSSGFLDSSFANNGIDTLRIQGLHTTTTNDYYTGPNFGITGNGNIVITGSKSVATPTKYQLYLTETDSNGVVNPAFGVAGSLTSGETYAIDAVKGMFLNASGKIILWGSSENNFALARYTNDGLLDTTFGNLSGKDTISDLVIFAGVQDPSGKMYFTSGYDDSVSLWRMDPDGFMDLTFGVNGRCTFSFPSMTGGGGNSIALQQNGKIIIAAEVTDSIHSTTALFRVDASGMLDTSFADNGVFVFPDTSQEPRISLAPDGKILVVREMLPYFSESIFRINSDGTVDSLFMNQSLSHFTRVHSFSVQQDKKIIFFGHDLGENISFRLDSNGVLDPSFGINGADTLALPIGDYGYIKNHVVFPDYSYLISLDYFPAGWSTWNEPSEIHFIKYNTDGSIDSSWANNGTGIISIDSTPAYNHFFVLQPDQKILLGKTYWDLWPIENFDFCIARILTNLSVGIIKNDPVNSYALVYPNPISSNSFNVDYEITEAGDVYFTVADLSGKIVSEKHTMKSAGKHSETIQLVDNLPSGYYLLNILTNIGNVSMKFQLIR